MADVEAGVVKDRGLKGGGVGVWHLLRRDVAVPHPLVWRRVEVAQPGVKEWHGEGEVGPVGRGELRRLVRRERGVDLERVGGRGAVRRDLGVGVR